MIALPLTSACIGLVLGAARVRVTALFAVLCVLMAGLVICTMLGGIDGSDAVVFGILAVVLLQIGYVLALALRAFSRGHVDEEETSGLGVSRFH